MPGIAEVGGKIVGRRIAWALALSIWTAAGCRHVESSIRETAATPQDRALDAARRAIVGLETVENDAALNPVGEPRTAGGLSGGTGVIVDPSGLILTNAHVVEQARAIRVILDDGHRYTARVVAANVHFDLALVQIDCVDLPVLSPAPLDSAARQPVLAAGRPPGTDELLLRRGVVTRRVASLQAELDPAGLSDYSRLIESTAQIEPGFSGGPLLDRRGRLVGINVAVAEYTDGTFGYALRFDEAEVAALRMLIAQAHASRGVLASDLGWPIEPLIPLD